MITSSDLKVGDMVYLIRDGILRECCVKFHDEKYAIISYGYPMIVDLPSKYLFLSKRRACLYLAQEKQEQAAKLLTEAANLFVQGG